MEIMKQDGLLQVGLGVSRRGVTLAQVSLLWRTPERTSPEFWAPVGEGYPAPSQSVLWWLLGECG